MTAPNPRDARAPAGHATSARAADRVCSSGRSPRRRMGRRQMLAAGRYRRPAPAQRRRAATAPGAVRAAAPQSPQRSRHGSAAPSVGVIAEHPRTARLTRHHARLRTGDRQALEQPSAFHLNFVLSTIGRTQHPRRQRQQRTQVRRQHQTRDITARSASMPTPRSAPKAPTSDASSTRPRPSAPVITVSPSISALAR